MLLYGYIEVLLGSRAKVGVLRALWRHRGKEFTIRELAKFLGLSHAGVRKALMELEKINVVAIKTIGKSHTVKLNGASYAARIVEEIFKLEEGTLDELKRTLKEGLNIPEVISAALFGSVARGKGEPLSDIDLLVITDRRERMDEVISHLQGEIALRFGNTLMPYYLSKEEFKGKMNTPLIRQILESHVLIYGKRLA